MLALGASRVLSSTEGKCLHRPSRTPADDPAAMAKGGSSHAGTVNSYPTWTAGSRACVIVPCRPMQWREWSGGLRRCREGQGKGDSDQPDHFFLPLNQSNYSRLIPTWRPISELIRCQEYSRACREGRPAQEATSSARWGALPKVRCGPRGTSLLLLPLDVHSLLSRSINRINHREISNGAGPALPQFSSH